MNEKIQLENDLDETDIQLLERIEDDHEINLADLADELDLSKSAIHYRLNKLKDGNVVTSVSADIDPLQLGLNMLIITDVYASHEVDYAEDIGTALTNIDGVFEVYYTMGDVDFVTLARVQTREQMNELLNEIVSVGGVNETSSRFVMNEHETDGRVVSNMSEEMIDNVLES